MSEDAGSVYLLIQTEREVDLADLVSRLLEHPATSTASAVTGPFDVIAHCKTIEQTPEEIAASVAHIDGITRIVTLPTTRP